MIFAKTSISLSDNFSEVAAAFLAFPSTSFTDSNCFSKSVNRLGSFSFITAIFASTLAIRSVSFESIIFCLSNFSAATSVFLNSLAFKASLLAAPNLFLSSFSAAFSSSSSIPILKILGGDILSVSVFKAYTTPFKAPSKSHFKSERLNFNDDNSCFSGGLKDLCNCKGSICRGERYCLFSLKSLISCSFSLISFLFFSSPFNFSIRPLAESNFVLSVLFSGPMSTSEICSPFL